MLHLDYQLDVYPGVLVLDKEFPNRTLGANDGDLYRVKIVNGQISFHKIDELVQFLHSKDNNK